MKEVSIITPVYNVEKHIGNFLKSIINQTYRDFELILVNDGSTDNSVEVAKEVLNQTDIDYKIINKENRWAIKCEKQRDRRGNRKMDCYA